MFLICLKPTLPSARKTMHSLISPNPYYANARFRWLVPDSSELSPTYDKIQQLLGVSETGASFSM
jgi:hypothetical protein